MEADAQDPEVLARYEGLVFKTAQRYERALPDLREDLEDLRQIFRIKAWRALLSFDPSRSRMTRDAYVFSCLVNQGKSLLRKQGTVRKRGGAPFFIEDVAPAPTANDARDAWDLEHLSLSEEDVFAVVEDVVTVPSTLSRNERLVLGMLYLDFSQTEAASVLGLTKREVEQAVKAIRTKMADWKPSSGGEVIELPARHHTDAQSARAA